MCIILLDSTFTMLAHEIENDKVRVLYNGCYIGYGRIRIRQDKSVLSKPVDVKIQYSPDDRYLLITLKRTGLVLGTTIPENVDVEQHMRDFFASKSEKILNDLKTWKR